jgi:hypothetical protein
VCNNLRIVVKVTLRVDKKVVWTTIIFETLNDFDVSTFEITLHDAIEKNMITN